MNTIALKDNRFTLVLQTEKYLKKFVGSKIKIDPQYVLSKSDMLGTYLYMALDKDKYNVEFTRTKYNADFKIIIPHFYRDLGKYEFRPDAVDSCNLFMKHWFYESFIEHMNLCSMFSIRMDKSIMSFARDKNIDIDIDIQYDTLKKKYYRWRENKGQPIHKYIMEMIKD